MDRLYFLETYIPEHHAALRQEAAEAHMIKVAANTVAGRANVAGWITSPGMSIHGAIRFVHSWLRGPQEVTDTATLR